MYRSPINQTEPLSRPLKPRSTHSNKILLTWYLPSNKHRPIAQDLGVQCLSTIQLVSQLTNLLQVAEILLRKVRYHRIYTGLSSMQVAEMLFLISKGQLSSHVHRGVVPKGAGGAMAPPDFSRSVNPISNRLGEQIMPTI